MKRLGLLIGAAAFGLACNTGANDAEIASEVERTLSAETDLQGNSIDVASVDGEVTLMGSVDSSAERAHAQSVAERVEGVRSVRNQLGVEESTAAPGGAETPPVAAPPPSEPTDTGAETPETAPPADPSATDPSATDPGATPMPETETERQSPVPDPRPQGGATDPDD
ncbi:MAG TPA: BON domain-containing protein, partial [Myxococcota bacterium]|nr:BON domain-containing protein [Myxococcota bacterium]